MGQQGVKKEIRLHRNVASPVDAGNHESILHFLCQQEALGKSFTNLVFVLKMQNKHSLLYL